MFYRYVLMKSILKRIKKTMVQFISVKANPVENGYLSKSDG